MRISECSVCNAVSAVVHFKPLKLQMCLVGRLKFTWKEGEEEDGSVVDRGKEEGLKDDVEQACWLIGTG